MRNFFQLYVCRGQFEFDVNKANADQFEFDVNKANADELDQIVLRKL